jgi:sulfhydrogenase subunit alpha
MALRLKKLGNTIQEVVGGRAVHPVNYVIGGFGKVPTTDDLLRLQRELRAGLEDCRRTLDVLRGISLPSFVHRPIRCAALVPEDEAFFFGNAIGLSDAPDIPVREYRKLTNESCVPHSHAKRSAHDGRSYMVGALARLTLHGDRIGGLARTAWQELGFSLPADNIVLNNVAQAIEMVYSVEHALELIGELLETGLEPETPSPYSPHACEGTAATEVPRGTLFYRYEIDEHGNIAAADVITPTAQNLNNAEDQMRATVSQGPDAADEVLKHRLEIVARAYDPCISCSVHVVRKE